ncbi:tRNA (guanosine(46)-N7)-methyltransferase TrmB [Sulfidibacter corallicola]|uniref:tRNA (guanine-N(7)-)-methyltransferase n=1 Tax=Sulfidibacter corallicola TaxID=2818388 RepID=A0A8A4TMP0_SULCO|nr:tRNA (guanosine(46)-N7)-methyltransferase TrmB [Sulfidibacter corallicola]QTD50820.1 tRNA (guanosine(46)-N7)-methyltransferase TrmB [Sulfidibacter corallicola]
MLWHLSGASPKTGPSRELFNGSREYVSVEEAFIPKDQRVSRELVPEDHKAPLDFQEVFGNDHPVELEIGIGKGLFITHAGMHFPESNFIGIEIRRKYLNKARERVEKRPLANVRLICGEAFSFMEEYIPDASLAAIHVYFPDPWPKKRHHKRRLFDPTFMKETFRALVPGGHLLIATDHAGYWEHIQEVLQHQEYLIPSERLPEPPGKEEDLTNFEAKYKKEGRAIYRTGYRKPTEAP